MLLSYAYDRQGSAESFRSAKNCLDKALIREPDYVAALSAFTLVAADGYGMEWDLAEDERKILLEKALATGQRAIALAPDDAQSHWSLAYAEYVGGDVDNFHAHAERALTLNPNNADVMRYAGVLMAFSGDYERGLELIEKGDGPQSPSSRMVASWVGERLMVHWSQRRSTDCRQKGRSARQFLVAYLAGDLGWRDRGF